MLRVSELKRYDYFYDDQCEYLYYTGQNRDGKYKFYNKNRKEYVWLSHTYIMSCIARFERRK